MQRLMVPTYANAYGDPPIQVLMVPTYANAYGAHLCKCLWCPPLQMLIQFLFRLAGGGSLCQDRQARLPQAQLLVLNKNCLFTGIL